MLLYLVQHAEAQSKDVDPERSLTPKGQKDAIRMSKLAQKMEIKVNKILHSGKTRARQTAGILGEFVCSPGEVRETDGLGPMDDVQPIGDQLLKAGEDAMLVGHLPFMEKLAGYLLTGDPERKPVRFHNAGIVCLELDKDQRQVSWIALPDMFL